MLQKLTMTLALGSLMSASAAFSQGEAALNDAKIAHIAYTAGVIDVAAGKQALTKSRNKTVRAFASEMVRDHAAVNAKALALVKKLGVTPQTNPTSVALSKQASTELATLARLKGAEFDRAYVENEVAYHRTVNGALRDTLIPAANNGELKSLLSTGLTLFTEHQMHAEHIAKDLR
jgi:putative membrane protein